MLPSCYINLSVICAPQLVDKDPPALLTRRQSRLETLLYGGHGEDVLLKFGKDIRLFYFEAEELWVHVAMVERVCNVLEIPVPLHSISQGRQWAMLKACRDGEGIVDPEEVAALLAESNDMCFFKLAIEKSLEDHKIYGTQTRANLAKRIEALTATCQLEYSPQSIIALSIKAQDHYASVVEKVARSLETALDVVRFESDLCFLKAASRP